MYSKTDFSIKMGNYKTNPFRYSRGVRQGCILSPLLFNIYINELPALLDKTNLLNPFVLPNGEKLSCLLYADDLILLSQSQVGLQNSVNTLSHFCSTWNMEINMKKTKVMTFQKKSRRNTQTQIMFNGNKLENTNEYTYLGIKMTSSGNFTVAQEMLKEKAIHAIFSLKRNLNFSKLTCKTANKLFCTMIEPILTYNSEVWGAYVKNNFDNWEKNPIEKAHLRYCKLFLGVNKKAINIACRREMGKYPLKLAIDKKIIKYYTRLNNLPDTAIAKQALNISKQLQQTGASSYVSEISKLIDNIEDININISTISTSSLKTINKKIDANYNTFLNGKLSYSTRLEFLKLIKSKTEIATYLNDVRNIHFRIALSKLRVSNHSLLIETGRFIQLDRNKRICPHCLNNTIENELHFLFECSLYEDSRRIFYSKIYETTKIDLTHISVSEKIKHLFENSNSTTNFYTANYIYKNFEKRKLLYQ